MLRLAITAKDLIKRALFSVALAGMLVACGSSSNLLGLTVPDEHRDTFDALLDLARASYDRGALDEALKYAEKAYLFDPLSEDAAVLYGFVNLSLAGGDPFSLAKDLIRSSATKSDKKAALADDGDTSDTLNALKKTIGISTAELELMGTLDASDPELPLLIPKCVEQLRETVPRLVHVNRAIRAVCPFVDLEVRIAGDYRQGCDATKGERRSANQAHFMWAFAHLTEALAFNTILTYATVDPEGKKSNLELRVEKIKALDTSDTANLSTFLGAMTTVQKTLDGILPAGGKCSEAEPTSQLRATLNDMLAVDAAFGQMDGLPPTVGASIQKAMAKIKDTQQNGGQAGGNQTKAMRADFTKKMSKSLGDKVDAITNDPNRPIPAEQKSQLCSALAVISSGGDAPAGCAGG